MIRVAINGFGRIGRCFLRIAQTNPEIQVVAVNDLADHKTLAHLLKWDSVHGKANFPIEVVDKGIEIQGRFIPFFSFSNPSDAPWGEIGVDYVVESTGFFKTKELAGKHINAGAKNVVISAPSPDENVPTVVLGVNDHILEKEHQIFSNASCTTNSAAPLIKVVDELCGITGGYITTVHSYTGDQRLHDAPHKDLRRARAAAQSIVPTTTGAAKAITKIFPQLEGNFGGCGIRVPVPDGSLTDITCTVKTPKSVVEINAAFQKAAKGNLKGILEYEQDPIVSIDIVNNPHSCIFDAQLTSVIGGLIKVVGWYDNEWGYANRLVDLLQFHASL
ncbi:type I glyceraldehyde-3-phosphate dehydrogenase [Luteibaculum oceani]|uniref:Type I glyceraldehyde-3-phosphate dehydrogenase n=1 Tax=Luteibaculum oceani TaxID=1294296 RepID=A0A5C6UY94_9FLAO|nr:type I glyceraldehyde-3-phosphate dehydrogenase [Luteibaculum oceani]TXC78382.1 type I glyceraldehyde-3-phosphate dehydrogenase [Luteibaculum oceani]